MTQITREIRPGYVYKEVFLLVVLKLFLCPKDIGAPKICTGGAITLLLLGID